MLQNSTYSVISPEGCASILWRSPERAPEAAEAMAITSERLKHLALIDRIVEEPIGGAHRDADACARELRRVLLEEVRVLDGMDLPRMLDARYRRLMAVGRFQE